MTTCPICSKEFKNLMSHLKHSSCNGTYKTYNLYGILFRNVSGNVLMVNHNAPAASDDWYARDRAIIQARKGR